MNAGHFGLALVFVGGTILLGSAYGMSQVSTQDLEKPVEVKQTEYDTPRYIDLWTDPETGCKYVRSNNSGSSFVLRVKPDGMPLCE